MSPRVVTVAVLLSLTLEWSVPPVVRAQSGNCSQMLSQLNRDLGAFQKDLTKSGVDFLSDEVAKATKESITPHLKDTPFLDDVARISAYKEQLENLQQELKQYQAELDALLKCFNTKGSTLLGCASQSGKKVVRDWVKSKSMSEAAKRVKEASSLVKTYTARLQGTAQGSIGAAVSCLNDYQNAAQAKADQANLSNPPAGQTKPTPKSGAGGGSTSGATSGATTAAASGGGGAGGAVLISVLAIGGGAALGLAVKAASDKANASGASCTSQESATMAALSSVQNAVNSLTACGTNSACFDSRFGTYTSAFSKFGSALGSWCTCLGVSVQVDASEKAAIQQLWASAPALGFNPGTLPSCFR